MKKASFIGTMMIIASMVVAASDFDDPEIAAEGGLVVKPYKGKYVVIVNNQDRVSPDKFFAPDGGIEGLFNYPVIVIGKNESMPKAGIVVTVSDNSSAPSLLIAPEVPWAGVNVAALATDKPKQDVLESRLQKEIFRAFLFSCGVANSEIQPCLMRPILHAKDLDKSPLTQPGPSAIAPVMETASRLGIFEKTICTYREACQLGWAPSPTNEVQRAIWEKVKAEKNEKPANPIKINYDPAKGE